MQSPGDYSNDFHGEHHREIELYQDEELTRSNQIKFKKGYFSPVSSPLANGLSISEQLGEQKSPETPKSPLPCTDFDAAYFHSYAHVRIHEEMIKGIFFFVYPLVWFFFIVFAYPVLRFDSVLVVVDVGCGTGILSIFCAQAGAKRVYAVDASDIAVRAEEVLKANGLSDKVIVLHGRDVEIEEEADVIVSEWMGYMLLYEVISLFYTLFYIHNILSRDRWLKPGGLILPSHATLYMAPISHPGRYSHIMVFGATFMELICLRLAEQCAFEEPSVESISGENVLTWPEVVFPCYVQSLNKVPKFAISTTGL
ncbi:unnamed protein product [Brassica oleracea var. botrytis]